MDFDLDDMSNTPKKKKEDILDLRSTWIDVHALHVNELSNDMKQRLVIKQVYIRAQNYKL